MRARPAGIWRSSNCLIGNGCGKAVRSSSHPHVPLANQLDQSAEQTSYACTCPCLGEWARWARCTIMDTILTDTSDCSQSVWRDLQTYGQVIRQQYRPITRRLRHVNQTMAPRCASHRHHHIKSLEVKLVCGEVNASLQER
eukprot:4023229-Amphidinium_carterae.1